MVEQEQRRDDYKKAMKPKTLNTRYSKEEEKKESKEMI